jgi:hypothetical protein
MDKKSIMEIRRAVLDRWPDAEKVRSKGDEIHVYGRMPNSTTVGWWFLCYDVDYYNKGIDGII